MKIKLSIIISGIILLASCNNETASNVEELSNEVKEVVEEKIDTTLYLQKGSEIAQATFKVLSSNLKAAMQRGGVDEAIQFCSINAMPITDSLSQYHNAEIKRTSHKTRNPLNAPTNDETEMLSKYLSGFKEPTVQKNQDGSISYYSPIYTKGLCLTCHGKVENISNYKSILSKYPNDKAVGFAENDLRGIWSLTFKKE